MGGMIYTDSDPTWSQLHNLGKTFNFSMLFFLFIRERLIHSPLYIHKVDIKIKWYATLKSILK